MPPVSTAETAAAVIAQIRDAQLRNRATAALPSLLSAAEQFEGAMLAKSLFALPTTLGCKDLSRSELLSLYERLLRGDARAMYDQLLASAPGGLCPMCGHRTVSTIDHHAPQSVFAELSVATPNLVPTCIECNKAKLDARPTAVADQYLNPYYHHISSVRWLGAKVDGTSSVTFSVTPAVSWGPALTAMVNNQFDRLDLASLYATQAARELTGIRARLEKLFEKAGPQGVCSHLAEEAESRVAADPNSWQSATYDATASSDWFCGGGFRMVGL